MTNFNDLPLDNGAPGPYALVMPNGMRYVPYFSWSFITGRVPNNVFVPGQVVPSAFLGYYMGPGFESMFGVGMSCSGRCPCARVLGVENIVYVGPTLVFPPPDTGASAENPVAPPADMLFSFARNDVALSVSTDFDYSWMPDNVRARTRARRPLLPPMAAPEWPC